MGGHAVVKVPYSNAGQGRWTAHSAQHYARGRVFTVTVGGRVSWPMRQGGPLTHRRRLLILCLFFFPPCVALPGVFTITSPAELAAFMAEESRYDKYIVQSLVVRKRLAHAAHAHMF